MKTIEMVTTYILDPINSVKKYAKSSDQVKPNTY
jgi:hypothetical protein